MLAESEYKRTRRTHFTVLMQQPNPGGKGEDEEGTSYLLNTNPKRREARAAPFSCDGPFWQGGEMTKRHLVMR